MRKLATLVFAGCALASAPAFAQGYPSGEPAGAASGTTDAAASRGDTYGSAATVAENTFTGPWVGAVIGYDVSRSGSDYGDNAYNQRHRSSDGLLYGAAAGYDIDFGGGVIGVEGEVTDSTAKSNYGAIDGYPGYGIGRVSTGRDLYIGARAGIKVAPQVLAYVKGGYTNARYDVRASSTGAADFNDHIDADGWRIGAGAEYAVNHNTFAKLEYRYSNYSRAEFDYAGDISDSNRFDVDTDRHQVVASVGVRF